MTTNLIKLSGWYSPQRVADMGVILDYGYTGIYNLITEKDPVTGTRVLRRDDQRLEAKEITKRDPETGVMKVCRYKIQGRMIVDYLRKNNLAVPKVIN